MVTAVLTYPTAGNMGTRGVLTPGWGCTALGGLGVTEPPLLPSSMLCVWKGETPAALSWADLLEDAATPAPDGFSSPSQAGTYERPSPFLRVELISLNLLQS